MKTHLEIAGGSAKGAVLCSRTICAEMPSMMGEHNHTEIIMHTLPLSMYKKAIYIDDWEQVVGLMIVSVKKACRAGADFVICPDNMIHQPFESVLAGSSIPWLNIAEVAGAETQRIGTGHIGVLGSKYLMTGPVYTDALKKFNN